ncbi:myb-interacting protein 120 [Musca autumnalis]|uniref:myb-interacting protein 120 n=1 Tax=Musca autumnalis TaxID=221902 RepID=UPI003CF111B7
MDNLEDSSSLPELSFDDLLDSSPTKENGKAALIDEDSMEYDSGLTNPKDDSLNTPGPKQKPRMVPRNITSSFITSKAVPIRTNLVKTGTAAAGGSNQMTNYVKNQGNVGGSSVSGVGNTSSQSSTASAAPILLNTKNVFPKMATQITNNSIKLTPKTVASASTAGGVVTASTSGTTPSVLSVAGKTAVRTASGQLLYIQKTNTANTTTATGTMTKPGTTTHSGMVKTQQSIGTTSASGNKPVTIQVLRNADGTFVPIKTTTSSVGPKGNHTTLTLSPTTAANLAGKKIIASSGGQVLIKSNNPSGTSGNPNVKTMLVKQTTPSGTYGTNPKTIVVQNSGVGAGGGASDSKGNTKTYVVQGNNGKQILVTNQNLVKLSPKPPTTITPASQSATGSTTTTTTPGQIQAIQIAGKQGMQYVRVVPPAKTGTATTQDKLMTVTSMAATTSTQSMAAKSIVATTSTSSTVKTVTTSAPVKILNNLPQKFTVVQKGGGTKVVVTQKKDANGVEFTPIATKVQKTIVSMPSVKLENEDNGNQTIVRKHKISEINSELKRITASDSEDNGPPDVKKPATGNSRVVVISNNAPTILNKQQQQQHQSQQMSMRSVANSSSGNSIQVQGTRTANPNTNLATISSGSTPRTRIAAGDKMYTIIKPSAAGQQNSNKMYSVLKAGQVLTSTTTTQGTFTAPAATHKPLLNQQSLALKQQQQQQQQKIFHLKQLQKPKLPPSSSSNLNSSSNLSSTNYASIQIKEEPLEIFDCPNSSSTAFTTTNVNEINLHNKATTSSLLAPSTASLNVPSTLLSAAAALPSITASSTSSSDQKDDPEKLDLVGAVRRKHCNCSKSQCLKLYCDCFANGEFCQDCTCKDCCNNLQNEDERQRAIRSCLERNPSAFKPKITSSSDLGDMRLHNKGCNCKRSGCLKNYCECYEAKIPCSSNCKCVGCRNVEDRPDLDMDPVDPKIMATIANASASTSQKRSYDKSQRDSYGNTIKTEKYSKDGVKQEYGSELNSDLAPPEKQQCNFITQEVVDATIQCMVTQADECEKNGLPPHQMEKMVMEELGRCLVEIIDFSIRNTDTSYTQD